MKKQDREDTDLAAMYVGHCGGSHHLFSSLIGF